MEEAKKTRVIDLAQIFKRIIERRNLYYKALPTAFVLSCFIILCVPRYYTTNMSLAPEMESSGGAMGALGSLASSFGFDLDNVQTNDAINPMLYPDLIEDNDFIVKLFPIRVKSKDGEIDTYYYDYLKNYQESPWWSKAIQFIKSLIPKKEEQGLSYGNTDSSADFDPYALSKTDNNIAEAIRGNIQLSFDKKTGIIGLMVTDQDPLICKTVADSVRIRLQNFITEYRTNKARVDVDYYSRMTEKAKADYDQAHRAYAAFADGNTNVVLQSMRARMEDMENDMQLKYNTYSVYNTQLQAAKAKVQERTPAFTVLKGASIPIKPAGPKRMIFVIAMVFLTFLAITLYSIKDILFAE